MLTAIAIFFLVVLLFVSIKHVQYSLAIFMAMFMLQVNLNIFGINVFHFAIIEIVIGLLITKKQTNESIKGIDKYFITYTICTILLASISFISTQYISISKYFVTLIGFLLDYILIGLLFNHIQFKNVDIAFFDKIFYTITAIVILYAFYNYIFQTNPYQAYISSVQKKHINFSEYFVNDSRGVLKGRVSSTFPHPLMLGQVLLLVISYIIYKLKNGLYKWLTLFIIISVVFLTGSRSAIVPVIMTIIIYIFSFKKNLLKKNIIVIGAIFALAMVLIPQSYIDTIQSLVTFWDKSQSDNMGIQGSTTNMRNIQLQSAIQTLDSDIIIGRGRGYISLYGHKHPEMRGYESIIFTELFENGLIGLILFLIFYILLYIKLLKYAKSKRNKYRVHSLCIPFLLCGIMTGYQYGMFTIYIIFYILTLYNIINEETNNTSLYDTQNNTLLLAKRQSAS